jgi:hypothetical protein
MAKKWCYNKFLMKCVWGRADKRRQENGQT